jgi:hypothetical protein
MKLFVNGDLGEDESRLVESHINTCWQCTALRDYTKRLFDTVGELVQEVWPCTQLEKKIISTIGKQDRRRRWFITARAAAAMFLAFLGIYLVTHLYQTPGAKVTTALELETKLLKDGSALVLSKETELELKEPRHLRLHKGQIYIDVKKDTKTFKVETDLGTIKVLGTEFFIDFKEEEKMNLTKASMIVWVVAGVIGFTNPWGSLKVKEGQILCAQPQEAPKIVPKREISQQSQDQKDKMRIAKLIKELEDKDPSVRKGAIRGLVALGERVEKPLKKLKESKNKQVASWAGVALKILRVKKRLPERLWKVMPRIIEEIALARNFKEGTIILRRLLSISKDQRQYDLSGQEAYSLLKFIWKKKAKRRESKPRVFAYLLGRQGKEVAWAPRYALELLRRKERITLALTILEHLGRYQDIATREGLAASILRLLASHRHKKRGIAIVAGLSGS